MANGRAGAVVPMAVRLLYGLDLSLGLAFLISKFGGNPSTLLDGVINVGVEAAIPTWYSSTKLFAIAVLIGSVSLWKNRGRAVLKSRLMLFAAVFLFMSMDEIAQFHEIFSAWTDQFLPGGERQLTPLPGSGLWPILVFPFLIVLVPLLIRLRKDLPESRVSMRLFSWGFVVLLGGAVGVEFLGNFLVFDRSSLLIEVWVEESLEMIGATTLAWAALELCRSQGLSGGMSRLMRRDPSPPVHG